MIRQIDELSSVQTNQELRSLTSAYVAGQIDRQQPVLPVCLEPRDFPDSSTGGGCDYFFDFRVERFKIFPLGSITPTVVPFVASRAFLVAA